MKFNTLFNKSTFWVEAKGVDNSIVLSSRVRLARNVRDYPFPGWAKKEQRIKIVQEIGGVIASLAELKSGFIKGFSDLGQLEKQVLVERHLISRELAARGEGAAAMIDRNQRLSIMLNEEDHLRMQSIYAGLGLKKAYEELARVDSALEKELAFAFDAQYGYITACPTNLGTGMRASAMIHLPALHMSGFLSGTLYGISKLGMAVRGLFGEGTESQGYLFQISNQSTLGESEMEILERLERVITDVEQHEKNAREKLLSEKKPLLDDKIGRSLGILKYAHTLSSKEAFELISILRLGAGLGYFDSGVLNLCDDLLVDIQPAHLQINSGLELGEAERDAKRAEILRDKLHSIEIVTTISEKRVVETEELNNSPSLFDEYE